MRDKITHINNAKGSPIIDIYVPDYYESFRCIDSSCRDNCCIGWEIDIDREALERYMALDGTLGDDLRANITCSQDGSDCFKLTEAVFIIYRQGQCCCSDRRCCFCQ